LQALELQTNKLYYSIRSVPCFETKEKMANSLSYLTTICSKGLPAKSFS